MYNTRFFFRASVPKASIITSEKIIREKAETYEPNEETLLKI